MNLMVTAVAHEQLYSAQGYLDQYCLILNDGALRVVVDRQTAQAAIEMMTAQKDREFPHAVPIEEYQAEEFSASDVDEDEEESDDYEEIQDNVGQL